MKRIAELFKSKSTKDLENLILTSNDVICIEYGSTVAQPLELEIDRYIILNNEPIFKGWIQFSSNDLETAVLFTCKIWADNYLPIIEDWTIENLTITVDIQDNQIAVKRGNQETCKNIYESTRNVIESRIKALVVIK